jgi:hypothetical protein
MSKQGGNKHQKQSKLKRVEEEVKHLNLILFHHVHFVRDRLNKLSYVDIIDLGG